MPVFDPVPSLTALGLAPGALVLDAGCGTGLAARALARAGFRVVGVDFDLDALETARALDRDQDEAPAAAAAAGGVSDAAARTEYLVARAEALPCRDASFDAVVCLDVLHWCADEAHARALWDSLWRALRPGGALLVRCRMSEEGAVDTAGAAAADAAAAGASSWFLPSRALLDDWLAHGAGVWIEPPRSAGTPGAARLLARKPR